MKIFIDANVLVSVLNKEYPMFPYAAWLLSLADVADYKLTTSPICVAIAFYFAAEKHGEVTAKQKIALLLEHIAVANCGQRETALAAMNKKVHDLEDGIEYYTALHDNCDFIITHDLEDFYFSELEICTPETFLKKHYTA